MQKTIVSILIAATGFIGAAYARAELGMTKGECDDFYVQDGDPHGQKFDHGDEETDPKYSYKTRGMQVIIHTHNNKVIAISCKASFGIADNQIKDIAVRNGLDPSIMKPVAESNRYWYNATRPDLAKDTLTEFCDPNKDDVHLYIVKAKDSDKVTEIGMETKEAYQYLMHPQAELMGYRPYPGPATSIHLKLGMTKQECDAVRGSKPGPVADTFVYWARIHGRKDLKIMASFKDNKVIALDYNADPSDATEFTLESFTYSDIAALVEDSGLDSAGVVKVPIEQKWAGTSSSTIELYNPEQKGVHIIGVRQSKDPERLSFIRIENEDGKTMRKTNPGSTMLETN